MLEWLDARPLDAEALGRGLAPYARRGRAGLRRPAARRARRDVPARPARAARRSTADDWPALYGEHRLAPLLRLAADRGAVAGARRRPPWRRCSRGCRELCGPAEPPARLHGDLWSGNVLGPATRDRPGRARRPSRGRPRDAAPLRRAVRAALRRLRGGRTRSPTGTRRASRSSSCCRCSSTPCSSAAATAPRSSAPPAPRSGERLGRDGLVRRRLVLARERVGVDGREHLPRRRVAEPRRTPPSRPRTSYSVRRRH